MGASGAAWIKHKKVRTLRGRTGEYGIPPHPIEVRPGQRYAAREARVKVPFRIKAVDEENVEAVRETTVEERLRLRCHRLLATREDAQGRYYQCLGWVDRPSGYKTSLVVLEADPRDTLVLVPEWHPARSFTVHTSTLPAGSRAPDSWVGCRANLAAPSGFALNLHAFRTPTALEREHGAIFLEGGRSNHSQAPPRAHPSAARPGQHYRARAAKRGAGQLTVVDHALDPDGNAVGHEGRVQLTDGRRLFSVTLERLLATDAEGRGLHFEFRGGGTRRGTRVPALGRRRRS